MVVTVVVVVVVVVAVVVVVTVVSKVEVVVVVEGEMEVEIEVVVVLQSISQPIRTINDIGGRPSVTLRLWDEDGDGRRGNERCGEVKGILEVMRGEMTRRVLMRAKM